MNQQSYRDDIGERTIAERAIACLYALNSEFVHQEAKKRASIKHPLTKMERVLRKVKHEAD